MFKISLEAARVNAGYSQKVAAQKLNISNTTLGKWEKGESFPTADKIPEICELYGVHYDHINFLPSRPLKADECQEEA